MFGGAFGTPLFRGAVMSPRPDTAPLYSVFYRYKINRWLRAHFARDEHELPLLRAIKDAILAGKSPESGECRLRIW